MQNLILTTTEELDKLIQSSVRKVFNEQPKEKVLYEPPEQFLNINEAANYLNLAVQTLYGYTSKGLIPFIKKARKILFLKNDLEKWVMEGHKLTIQETKEKLIREGKL